MIARPATRPRPASTAKTTLPIVQRRAASIIVRAIVRRSAINGASMVPGSENPSSMVPDSTPTAAGDVVVAQVADHGPDVPDNRRGAERREEDSQALPALTGSVSRCVH